MEDRTAKWQQLIGPVEWRELCAAYHGRKTALWLDETNPARFAGLVAQWEIDAITRFTQAPYNPHAFRLVKAAKTIQPEMYTDRAGKISEEALHRLRAAGASLVVGYFENYSNSALALTRELEAECHCPVQVNLYETPAHQQGLGSHVDSHDVLILQIAGEKTWMIFEGSEPTAPHREIVLRSGNWLFLPKGIRHDVRNRGTEPSLHFTVGFHPLRWGDVLERALTRARVSDPVINDPLPYGEVLSPAPEAMRERLGALVPFIDLPNLAATYYGEFTGLKLPVPREHDIPLEQRSAIRADSALRWREEAVWTPATTVPSTIMLPYRRAPLKLRPQWNPAVETMRTKGRFVPAELPLDASAAVLLCQLLSGTGMLSIAGKE